MRTLDDITENLTPRERTYVHMRMRGMSETASYRAAGSAGVPNKETWNNAPSVVAALREAMEISSQETGITRKKVTDMLLDAYNNSATALEQVAAARELAKLHGLYAPATVKVAHTHQHSIQDKRDNIKNLSTRDLELMLRDVNAVDGEFEPVRMLEDQSGST